MKKIRLINYFNENNQIVFVEVQKKEINDNWMLVHLSQVYTSFKNEPYFNKKVFDIISEYINQGYKLDKEVNEKYYEDKEHGHHVHVENEEK